MKVKDGLMSGWKMTSLYGTLMNMFIFRSIAELCNFSYDHYFAQGDDLDIVTDDLSGAYTLIDAYKKLGFKVARDKFYINSGFYQRSDFLRQVYGENGIYGFPCRMISGLIYTKPWNEVGSKRKFGFDSKMG